MLPIMVHYYCLNRIKLSPYENNSNHLDKHLFFV